MKSSPKRDSGTTGTLVEQAGGIESNRVTTSVDTRNLMARTREICVSGNRYFLPIRERATSAMFRYPDFFKDFDLLMKPNQAHGYAADGPYMMRRRWASFVTWLMGAEPPREYKMRQ